MPPRADRTAIADARALEIQANQMNPSDGRNKIDSGDYFIHGLSGGAAVPSMGLSTRRGGAKKRRGVDEADLEGMVQLVLNHMKEGHKLPEIKKQLKLEHPHATAKNVADAIKKAKTEKKGAGATPSMGVSRIRGGASSVKANTAAKRAVNLGLLDVRALEEEDMRANPLDGGAHRKFSKDKELQPRKLTHPSKKRKTKLHVGAPEAAEPFSRVGDLMRRRERAQETPGGLVYQLTEDAEAGPGSPVGRRGVQIKMPEAPAGRKHKMTNTTGEGKSRKHLSKEEFLKRMADGRAKKKKGGMMGQTRQKATPITYTDKNKDWLKGLARQVLEVAAHKEGEKERIKAIFDSNDNEAISEILVPLIRKSDVPENLSDQWRELSFDKAGKPNPIVKSYVKDMIGHLKDAKTKFGEGRGRRSGGSGKGEATKARPAPFKRKSAIEELAERQAAEKKSVADAMAAQKSKRQTAAKSLAAQRADYEKRMAEKEAAEAPEKAARRAAYNKKHPPEPSRRTNIKDYVHSDLHKKNMKPFTRTLKQIVKTKDLDTNTDLNFKVIDKWNEYMDKLGSWEEIKWASAHLPELVLRAHKNLGVEIDPQGDYEEDSSSEEEEEEEDDGNAAMGSNWKGTGHCVGGALGVGPDEFTDAKLRQPPKSHAEMMGAQMASHLLDYYGGNYMREFGAGYHGKPAAPPPPPQKERSLGEKIKNEFVNPQSKLRSQILPKAQQISEYAELPLNILGTPFGQPMIGTQAKAATTVLNKGQQAIGKAQQGEFTVDGALDILNLIPRVGGRKSKKPSGETLVMTGGKKRRAKATPGDGRKKRATIVAQVMKKRGLSMIEASKVVKKEGLY